MQATIRFGRDRASRAAAGGLAAFAAVGINLSLQVLLAPIILRVSGQETLGAYAVLLQCLGYLSLIDTGVTAATTRFLAYAWGSREWDRFRSILRTGRTFLLGTNVLFALFAISLTIFLPRVLSLRPIIAWQMDLALYAVAAWAMARTPLVLFGSGLTATQHIAAAHSLGIVGSIWRACATLVLVSLGTGVVGLMLGSVTGDAVTYFLQRRACLKMYPELRVGWGIGTPELGREILRFAGLSTLITLAAQMISSTDSIVVGSLRGAVGASIYYTTYTPASVCWNLFTRALGSTSPGVTEVVANGNRDEVHRAYLKLLKYALLSGVLIAGGVSAFSERIITLWVGPRQYAGALMIISLTLLTLTMAFHAVHLIFLQALGQLKWFTRFSIFSGSLHISLAYLLGSRIGVQGVAVGSASAEVLLVWYAMIRYAHVLEIEVPRIWSASVKPAAMTGLLVIPLSLSANALVRTSGLFPTIAFLMVYCALASLAVATIGLGKADRAQFRGILRQLLKGLRGSRSTE